MGVDEGVWERLVRGGGVVREGGRWLVLGLELDVLGVGGGLNVRDDESVEFKSLMVKELKLVMN